MIVTINNENGTTTYDVSKVKDENIRTQATVMINKVGQLEVLLEALNFTSSTHRANLEALLKDCPESLVENKEEEVVEDTVETPTEDGGATDSKD
jgi:ribonuclease PH